VERGLRADHDALMWHFLGELERRYQELKSGHLEPRWQAIRHSLALLGDRVQVQDHDVTLHGVLHGIDDEGALLLDQSGTIRRVVVGDLTRGPRPSDAPDV
jgi:biotin-(acetyl-CoA carboxylase) ligase